jgi:hypothetical protein
MFSRAIIAARTSLRVTRSVSYDAVTLSRRVDALERDAARTRQAYSDRLRALEERLRALATTAETAGAAPTTVTAATMAADAGRATSVSSDVGETLRCSWPLSELKGEHRAPLDGPLGGRIPRGSEAMYLKLLSENA